MFARFNRNIYPVDSVVFYLLQKSYSVANTALADKESLVIMLMRAGFLTNKPFYRSECDYGIYGIILHSFLRLLKFSTFRCCENSNIVIY